MTEYLVDAGQRTILFWDAIRQRGNQYLEHMAREMPHVLSFEYDLIIDGRALPEAYFKGGSIIGFATLLGFLAAILSKCLEAPH